VKGGDRRVQPAGTQGFGPSPDTPSPMSCPRHHWKIVEKNTIMLSHTVPRKLLEHFAFDDPVTRSKRLWRYQKGRPPPRLHLTREYGITTK
jgi:hypothetical protein